MRPSGDGGPETISSERNGASHRAALAVVACSLAVVAGLVTGADLFVQRSDVVMPGVRVAGIPLGGLRKKDALALLEKTCAAPSVVRLMAQGAQKAPLNIPSRDVRLAVEAARAVRDALRVGREGWVGERLLQRWQAHREGVDIPIRLSAEPAALKWVLENSAARRFASPAVDAGISVKAGQLIKTPERVGTAVDVAASLKKATGVLLERPADVLELPIVLRRDLPSVTLADLEPIDTILATQTTVYNSYERDRTHNLKLAARAVDGVILKPGAEFSYNRTVGPRAKSLGFRDAPIFVNGQIEPGTGGGICQISSTLYQAALLAGMQIRQRSHHSMAVRYAPPGLDATVSYGVLDLKFVNPLKNAVYIKVEAEGGRARATIYGASSDRKKIRIERTVSKPVPYGTKTIVNPSLPPGTRKVVDKGVNGYAVVVRRVIEENGHRRVETISRDRYRPHPVVIAVGPPAATRPAASASGVSPAEE
ncbi:MAG: hypothetical protein KatS3mg024_0874 [Armatimonadota bacterium]|nr:MAG: hypothetical protein KatS3mg024_0874 [Armatimonadota bacterium]